MAEHITEGLEMYNVEQLRFLRREDLNELDLTDDEKRRLLTLAETAKRTVEEMMANMTQNEYLVCNL